ncbi:unnamed protein product [Prorocentrum cordatum]|uniref:Calcineurin-like phosphoesterase domain-containing protein n=1 Tax=Prorocentrum cordatum TaxID=2364126 RepID=A0ABN9YHC4_9DINO|nr:unnamed protein product [Polarella glacialis]
MLDISHRESSATRACLCSLSAMFCNLELGRRIRITRPRLLGVSASWSGRRTSWIQTSSTPSTRKTRRRTTSARRRTTTRSRSPAPQWGRAGCGSHGEDWFGKLWKEQREWLDDVVPASTAEWRIVVTHFPPCWGAPDWKKLAPKHEFDLVIAGHRHIQDPDMHAPGDERKTVWHADPNESCTMISSIPLSGSSLAVAVA